MLKYFKLKYFEGMKKSGQDNFRKFAKYFLNTITGFPGKLWRWYVIPHKNNLQVPDRYSSMNYCIPDEIVLRQYVDMEQNISCDGT